MYIYIHYIYIAPLILCLHASLIAQCVHTRPGKQATSKRSCGWPTNAFVLCI